MAKKTAEKIGPFDEKKHDAAMKKKQKYQYKVQGVVYTVTPEGFRSLDDSIFKEVLNIEVDYSDLNTFISSAYQLSKDFECHIESPNDSTHSFRVSAEELDNYEQKRLEKIKTQGWCAIHETGTVLNDLCHKKIIKPGNYLVSVCW